MATYGTLSIIRCPKCGQSLAPSAAHCQFCGAGLEGVVRPPGSAQSNQQHIGKAPVWQQYAHWALAGLWMLTGLLELLQAFKFIPTFMANFGLAPFFMLIGSVDVILGFGLFFENESAIALAKIRAGAAVLLGVLGFVLAGADATGVGIGAVFAVIGIFQIYILNVLGSR